MEFGWSFKRHSFVAPVGLIVNDYHQRFSWLGMGLHKNDSLVCFVLFFLKMFFSFSSVSLVFWGGFARNLGGVQRDVRDRSTEICLFSYCF